MPIYLLAQQLTFLASFEMWQQIIPSFTLRQRYTINDCTMRDTENFPVVSFGIPLVIQKGLEHNTEICSLAPLRAAAVRTDGPSQCLLCPMHSLSS